VDRIIGVVSGKEPAPTEQPRRRASSGHFDFGTLALILIFAVPLGGVLLRSIFGTVGGSFVGGSIIGAAVWFFVGSLIFAGIAGVIAFIVIAFSAFSGRGGVGGPWLPGGGGGSAAAGILRRRRILRWRWRFRRRRCIRRVELIHDLMSGHRPYRLWHHLVTDHWSARRAFAPRRCSASEATIAAGDATGDGALRFVVEPATAPAGGPARRGPRERALEVFGRLRIWDTEENCGVLLYLLCRSCGRDRCRSGHSSPRRRRVLAGDLPAHGGVSRTEFEGGAIAGIGDQRCWRSTFRLQPVANCPTSRSSGGLSAQRCRNADFAPGIGLRPQPGLRP
jgi:hypothetical protein